MPLLPSNLPLCYHPSIKNFFRIPLLIWVLLIVKIESQTCSCLNALVSIPDCNFGGTSSYCPGGSCSSLCKAVSFSIYRWVANYDIDNIYIGDTCEPFTYKTCEPCIVGCTTCLTSTTCSQCLATRLLVTSTECRLCSSVIAYCSTCLAGPVCTSCLSGYSATGPSTCTQCSDLYGVNCTACNSARCTDCSTGFAMNSS